MPNPEQYTLHVEWDGVKLPRDIGPFPTRDEAERWAGLNIMNGSWEIWPLAWPYHTRGLAGA